MSRLTEKQALIDEVREQYSNGMITHLEFLNGAVVAVNDFDEAHVSARRKFFSADEDLVGLQLAISVASICNRIEAENKQLNFYI